MLSISLNSMTHSVKEGRREDERMTVKSREKDMECSRRVLLQRDLPVLEQIPD